MRLVIDTNIIISALIKDFTNRKILLLPLFDFLLPEYVLEEINEHKDGICELSRLNLEYIKKK